jgi:hypothetical protein
MLILRVAERNDVLVIPADESYGGLTEAALRMGLAPELLFGTNVIVEMIASCMYGRLQCARFIQGIRKRVVA